MVGITSFHTYTPPYRLSRDEISRVWGTRNMGGERAVAKYDEDSLTMALAAALGCLNNSLHQADGLFFASTTSPYKEKQAAAILAAAADLPRDTRTADFTNSLRAATIAIQSAQDPDGTRSPKAMILRTWRRTSAPPSWPTTRPARFISKVNCRSTPTVG
jgi:hydroxymethylglutaryl-CoA synthase